MRILGIDPGLNVTGYGVIDAEPGGGSRWLRRGSSAAARAPTATGRLLTASARFTPVVAEVIASLQPEAVAIEELYSHYERVKTSILMGHARGVIVLAGVSKRACRSSSYAATQIKRILTGAGRAPKDQMQLADPTQELGLPATAGTGRT